MSVYRVRQGKDNHVLYKLVEDLPSQAHQVFRDGFFGYMAALKKVANKEILRKPKGGKKGWRRTKSGGRRRHTASAPGETHANASGTLRRSLSWKVNGWESAEFGYGISTNAQNKAPDYAEWVTHGTRFMAPRPSLMNAVRATPRDIHFERAVQKMERGFET